MTSARDVITGVLMCFPHPNPKVADAILAAFGCDDSPVAIVDGQVRRLEDTGMYDGRFPLYVLAPEVDQ